MKLTKFEQSGFIIETNNGFRLAIDIANKTPVEKLENITVDAMIASHIHGDHFSLEQIKKISPKKLYINQECKDALGEESSSFEVVLIKADSEINIEDINIKIFNVDHGPNTSSPLKENFGFLLTVDGEKIYFAGDIFYPSGIDVSELEVDYALLPVGTFYTFGPEEAFLFAKSFKRISKVVPMHFEKTPATLNQFIELAKDNFAIENL